MEQRSLYDRLGGEGAVSTVIEDFVGRCAGDDRINGKFARTDIPRLKAKLIEQVTWASGAGDVHRAKHAGDSRRDGGHGR